VASFFYTPSNPVVNQVIQFNATESHDPDGTIVSYQWDFGDGTPGVSGVLVEHYFTSKGTYTVYLRVTDNSGNTDSATQTITVSENQSPTASFFYSPTNPVTGSAVHFNASASTDPDGKIEKYNWDFGDGESDSVEESQVEHTYDNAGTYNVVLEVVDDSENRSSTSKQLIVVDGSTPIASFTISPSSPKVNVAVQFNASDSKDPDGGNIKTYSWDFGVVGATGTGVTATYTYANAGTYTVWLTVTDDEDDTASTSKTVTVTL
jgi:PKD repeat protein